MAYVQLEDVGKTFRSRNGQPFVALDGVNLEIEEGEFVSVIGHSGCGKSTMLNLVAGLLPYTAGTIAVAGKTVDGPGPERMVVFQNHSLLPWLTLRQNVALAVDEVHSGLPAKERAARVQKYLDMVHLKVAADRLPHQVSGGMKQRCGIARGLAVEPKCLLLDEPFGALDALTRADLQDQLAKIWEANRITVMMITHDVDEALLLSDKIVMMSNGPAAKVAEVMKVELPRPRERVTIVDHPTYYRQRGELLYFLNKCKKSKAKKAAPKIGKRDSNEITVGFVPLTDCLPFAAAQTEGIFEKHGLKVKLSREPSWKAIAEGVREGRLDAAQMVTGMPIAESLGIGGRSKFPVSTAMMLSRGGNAITINEELYAAGVRDGASLRRYIVDHPDARLTFGMTHPASMHNLLLRAWLADAQIDPEHDLELVVIPPPQMVANIEAQNIAGYCVGEPWNLRAASARLGYVCATDADIWKDHPEKVLGVSSAWAQSNPKTHLSLIKAMLEACKLSDDPDFRKDKAPKLLAERQFIGGKPIHFSPTFTGPYDFGHNERRTIEDFVTFFKDGANLCRTNEMMWVAAQMARWGLCAYDDVEAIREQLYLEGLLREAADSMDIKIGEQRIGILDVVGGPAFDVSRPGEYLANLAYAKPAAPRNGTRKPFVAA